MKNMRRRSAGFTLVELIVVILFIGMLVVLVAAAPAFEKWRKGSMTAEAVDHVSRMFAGSVAYFEAEHRDANGNLLPKHFPASVSNIVGDCSCQTDHLCPGNGPEWLHPSWQALGFSIKEPFRYRPRYYSAGEGQSANFSAEATGDLDCDGTEALVKRVGAISVDGIVVGGELITVDEVK